MSALLARRGAAESAGNDAPSDIRRLIFFSLLGVVMGIVGAIAAWVLYHLIMIFTGLAFYHALILRTPLYPPTSGLGIQAIVVPVVGALIVGVMAKYGTDRIRGHGIPEAMEAVLALKAKVSPRIAIFKPISAAVAVGTGGPFGAEGPIIQTAGAIGSLIGQSMELSASERRTLLACGGAAGMVGIFNTPIAAVALALELLLFEFSARSLIPVILASGVAFALRPLLLGSAVMFQVNPIPSIGGPLDLLWFLPLGIIIGGCAVVISKALYFVEEYVEKLHIDMIFKPALGAVVLGMVALFQPRVLGMGYTTITSILDNHFSNGTLAGLAIGKSIALIASLGAGTSGGLLAPMLLIGAAIGSGYGRFIGAMLPGVGINPSICGIVAMSSLFSAAARAPLTSFIFAFELTGDYHALAPLIIGCMVADIVARALWSESVMTARLTQRGVRVSQSLTPNVFESVSVGAVMTRAVESLSATMSLGHALRALLGEPVAKALLRSDVLSDGSTVSVALDDARGAHTDAPAMGAKDVTVRDLGSAWSFPVLDDHGALVGMISRGDVLTAAARAERLNTPILELASREVVRAYAHESLDAALLRMLSTGYSVLPVVERDAPSHVVGVLSRGDVLRARELRSVDDLERRREFAIFARRARRSADLSGVMEAEVPMSVEPVSEARDPLASAEEESFDLSRSAVLPDERPDDSPRR